MLNVLTLALGLLCLWRVKIWKPWGAQWNEGYLSVAETTSLRGVLAVVVILGHLALQTVSGGVFFQMSRVGYMAVAVFFFLSGYGLQRQHMTRPDYAKGFLRKRLLSVALPYVIVSVLFWVYYACGGRVISVQTLLTAAIRGNFIVTYSWYIVEILLFYVAFWLLMRICGKRQGLMVIGGLIWYGAFTAFCLVMGYSNWWYMSSLPLVVGMAWAVYEKQILAVLRKYYLVLLAAVVCVLGGMLLLSGRFFNTAILKDVAKIVIAVLFTLAVVLVLLKVRIGNPVLHFLGEISMELYLLQGLAMMLMRNQWLYIQHSLLYCVLVLLVDVALAALLHMVMKLFRKKTPTR